MTLAPGTRLGPYEILSPIGAGGMGEVYKARDMRLDRTVAVKVLAADLSGDSELRQRFQREARAISALSHPHICALHDIGTHEGVDYLVMEYLEGETLASRLARGSLPLEQVLRYGMQIADALDKAHRQGIVHRDLKPGNIMVARSGVKLLDFGLARRQPRASSGSLSELATEAPPLTTKGTILGTLQYMAPEQLDGREADARSDIFAFGAVLYEMATGKKAFTGASQASVIASVLTSEPPPLSALQPAAPQSFDRLVRRCLAKDPEDRWQTARDLMLELRWIAEAGAQSGLPVPPVPRRRRWERLSWAFVGLVVGAAGAAVALREWVRPRPPERRAVTRLVLPLDPPPALSLWQRPNFALSPDGTRFAYAATRNGRPQLFLRFMEKLESAPLPGTEDADGPFFSPDGQWIGFFAASKMKKISVAGGSPVVLTGVPPVTRGASWGSDDRIIFSIANATGLWRVSGAGGAPEVLTRLDIAGGEQTHRWPDILPGGKAVLFTVGSGGSFDEARIAVARLDGGEKKILIEKGTCPRYVPTGHIVFARGGALLAAPFDLKRLEVTGSPVPVVEGVRTEVTGAGHFSFSGAGSLVYLPGSAQAAPEAELVWVDRQGAVRAATQIRGSFVAPRISPDGSRVAVTVMGSRQDVWIHDLARGTLTRLTLQGGEQFDPVWTPDGARVAYSSERAEQAPMVFWKPADGTGREELLSKGGLAQFAQSWSPDTKTLALTEFRLDRQFDILTLSGRGPTRGFLVTEFSEAEPTFSPDGRWLAYTSNESGRYEVSVRPYPGPGSKVQISSEGGMEPAWAPGGEELFYRNGEKMMAVAVRLSPTLSAAKPRILFEGNFLSDPDPEFRQYDVSPDGRRFLMIRRSETASPPPLTFLAEWFSDLARRAPATR